MVRSAPAVCAAPVVRGGPGGPMGGIIGSPILKTALALRKLTHIWSILKDAEEPFCAPQQIWPPMTEMGQKPALPHRSIAVRFALQQRTLSIVFQRSSFQCHNRAFAPQ